MIDAVLFWAALALLAVGCVSLLYIAIRGLLEA